MTETVLTLEHYDMLLELARQWVFWEKMWAAWRNSSNAPDYYRWKKEAKEDYKDYVESITKGL